MSEVNVHKVAAEGFGSGTNELYDRARPRYQPAALAHIRNSVRGSPPLNIVEIGAGTGIFTRGLLEHPDWANAVKELRAIEPSAGMRAQFSSSTKDARVSVADGTFDTTGVEDGWADAIIVAQAFHWCPDYEKASREFARILKPDGILALIWNLEDRETAKWVAQLRDRYERHELGTPQYRLLQWRATFSTESYNKHFEPPEEQFWSYNVPGTRDLVIERVLSKSYITLLSGEENEVVKKDVGEIIDRGDGLVWSDKEKGVFDYPYKTQVVIAKKK